MPGHIFATVYGFNRKALFRMKYIIASIGRSGSTLVSDLLSQATGTAIKFTSDISSAEDGVYKTHIHFKFEPDNSYKAIFIYSKDITDVIASMYSSMNSGRVDMKKHLVHLEVLKRHRLFFWMAVKIGKLLRYEKIIAATKTFAFRYMITNDKFRFKESALSWKSSKNVLFVAYEDLCESKDNEMLRMSTFLGFALPDFKVRKRQAKDDNTPTELIDLALREYKDFFRTLVER